MIFVQYDRRPSQSFFNLWNNNRRSDISIVCRLVIIIIVIALQRQ